jgi:ankyrin repeat protein
VGNTSISERAIYKDNYELLQYLLNHGMDLSFDTRRPPLVSAASSCSDPRIFTLLIERGADVNETHSGTSSWVYLLNREPFPETVYKNDFFELLHIGGKKIIVDKDFPRFQIADMFLEAGFDIHFRDKFDNTLLHEVWWNPEAIQYLIDHGVDINAQNANGKTVLDNAYEYNNNNIREAYIAFLESRGAKRGAY